MSKTKFMYRVYEETITGGYAHGVFLPEEYDKAKSLFDDLVAKGHEAVHLQELNQEYGWLSKTLEKHVTEEFKARNKAYWEMQEKHSRTYWRQSDTCCSA